MHIPDQVAAAPQRLMVTCTQAASTSFGWDKILPILVATIVAVIAFLQWYTAREKLRLDLYNRRFDIYASLLEFLSRINDVGTDKVAAREILIRNCVKAAREAQFLFAKDAEITNLIDRLRINATTISDFYLVVMPHASLYGTSLPEEVKARQRAEASIAIDLPDLEKRLLPFLAFSQGNRFSLRTLPFVHENKALPSTE